MAMTDAILDHPDIQRVLFHPRRDYGFEEPGVHSVSVEVEPGVTLGGRLYPTSDPRSPAVLYYHGNGEIAADYDDIADLYTQMGLALLVIDYRGYGTSSGTPTPSNLISDANTLFSGLNDIFAAYELAPARLYVMGRSLGSVPAIEIALHGSKRLSGLIIESGFADTFGLLERLGLQAQGVNEDQHGFGNAQKMERITMPTLILHGRNDVLIPPSDGQALYDHCAASEKHLVLIPGAGHNDIMLVGMKHYFEAIRSFVFGSEEH
jgi:hypothetical protein